MNPKSFRGRLSNISATWRRQIRRHAGRVPYNSEGSARSGPERVRGKSPAHNGRSKATGGTPAPLGGRLGVKKHVFLRNEPVLTEREFGWIHLSERYLELVNWNFETGLFAAKTASRRRI